MLECKNTLREFIIRDASLSATDLIYNNSIPAILQYYTFSRRHGDLQWLTVSNKLSEVSRPVKVVLSEKPYVLLLSRCQQSRCSLIGNQPTVV